MSYEEFNRTFNKRDYRGIILECSVITLDGEVIKRGTVEEVGDFMDLETDPIWKDHKFAGNALPDGREVVTTNIADWENDSYAKYIKNKLHI